MDSCLYECVIAHRRVRPRNYAFQHRIMMLYADLDELPQIDRDTRLLSHNRGNLYSFRDSDYFPTGTGGDLKARVRTFLQERGIDLPERGRVRLLTLPRILGYIFNPISLVLLFGRVGCPAVRDRRSRQHLSRNQTVSAARAANPLADSRCGCPSNTTSRLSPKLDISFDFDCLLPRQTLQVHIEDWDGEGRLLESHLRGRRVPLSDYQLLRFALKFPALTLKVITLIHWHALRLAMKRVPWYRKAHRPELQRAVLNPSPSLTTHTGTERHAH